MLCSVIQFGLQMTQNEIGTGDFVVKKPGGGYVMCIKETDGPGRAFCVSIDKGKTIQAWFDLAQLKKAQRRSIRISF
jgi:hypothetical protein